MSTKWSYSGDPSSSKRDGVRFLIGDVIPSEPIMNDAEIDFCVMRRGSVTEAAIAAAQAAIAKFARKVRTWDGQTSTQQQQIVEHYQALVKELIDGRKHGVVNVYAGGISVSQKDSTRSDVDRVRPVFSRNMHDNQRSGAGVIADEETP